MLSLPPLLATISTVATGYYMWYLLLVSPACVYISTNSLQATSPRTASGRGVVLGRVSLSTNSVRMSIVLMSPSCPVIHTWWIFDRRHVSRRGHSCEQTGDWRQIVKRFLRRTNLDYPHLTETITDCFALHYLWQLHWQVRRNFVAGFVSIYFCRAVDLTTFSVRPNDVHEAELIRVEPLWCLLGKYSHNLLAVGKSILSIVSKVRSNVGLGWTK